MLARHRCSSPTNPAPERYTRLSPRSASRVGRSCFGDWSQYSQAHDRVSIAAQVNFERIEGARAVKIGMLARHRCSSPTNPSPERYTRLSPRSASRVGRSCFGDWSQYPQAHDCVSIAAQVKLERIEGARAVKIGVLARHRCSSPTNPVPERYTRLSPRSASRVGRSCFGDWSPYSQPHDRASIAAQRIEGSRAVKIGVLTRHRCSSPTNPVPERYTRLSPRSASRVGRSCFGDWSQCSQAHDRVSIAAQVKLERIEGARAVKIGVLARHRCSSPTNPAPERYTRLSPRSASRVGRSCFGDWSQYSQAHDRVSIAAQVNFERIEGARAVKIGVLARHRRSSPTNPAPERYARLSPRSASRVGRSCFGDWSQCSQAHDRVSIAAQVKLERIEGSRAVKIGVLARHRCSSPTNPVPERYTRLSPRRASRVGCSCFGDWSQSDHMQRVKESCAGALSIPSQGMLQAVKHMLAGLRPTQRYGGSHLQMLLTSCCLRQAFFESLLLLSALQFPDHACMRSFMDACVPARI